MTTTQEQALAAAISAAFPSQSEWSAQTEALAISEQLDALGWKLTEVDAEPLPTEAKARRGGPRESDEAAKSIGNLSARHRAVLAVVASFSEPFTYDELVYRYESRYLDGWHEIPKQSPASIRSRCAELRRAEWVNRAGTGQSDTGHAAALWIARPWIRDAA